MKLPVKGYEGIYEVSHDGRVFSILQTTSRRIGELKPYVNEGGYLRVNLYNRFGKVKKYYVHRLVALHFINQEKGKNVVNHINGDKSNNHVANLEWCSQKENIKHSFETELQPNCIPTYVNGERFRTMKEASIAIGLKPFRISHERRKRGNSFQLFGHSIKCGDANVQY